MIDIDQHRGLIIKAFERGIAPAAGQELCATGQRVFHLRGNFTQLLFRGQAAEIDFIGARTLTDRSDSLDDVVDKLPVHRRFDVNPLDGRADLATVHQCAPNAGAGGALEIGVFEHDQRVFAAQFQRYRQQPFSGPAHDSFTGFDAAGKRDHIGVIDQRFTGGAVANGNL